MSQSSSNVNIGPKPIGAVSQDADDNVDEYLGFLVFSTTGEVLVPREWLVEQFDRRDIPEAILPRKPSRWSAYRRTMSELLTNSGMKYYRTYDQAYNQEFQCKLVMEKSDEMGSNVFIVYSKTFFPEDIIGVEGGDWQSTRLGHFDFHSPDDGPGGLVSHSDIEKDHVHYPRWEDVVDKSRILFQKMQEYHNHADLQNVLEDFRGKVANAVPIRRAVYFVGAHHQDTVEGLAGIWNEMNAYKDDGEEMRIETTPVVNLKEQRELIASRATDMVEDMVDDIVNETIQEWQEEEERTADQAARTIMNELSESESVTAEYNQLLATRLSVKEILQDRLDDFAEDQEEIIQKVLNQQTFEEVGQ